MPRFKKEKLSFKSTIKNKIYNELILHLSLHLLVPRFGQGKIIFGVYDSDQNIDLPLINIGTCLPISSNYHLVGTMFPATMDYR
jgi:hypothetical protein